jgi:mRNA interferase RelE/StbE
LKISDKILNLENELKPMGCIKLQDENAYRIRVGDYRILFEVNEEEKKVLFIILLTEKMFIDKFN